MLLNNFFSLIIEKSFDELQGDFKKQFKFSITLNNWNNSESKEIESIHTFTISERDRGRWNFIEKDRLTEEEGFLHDGIISVTFKIEVRY